MTTNRKVGSIVATIIILVAVGVLLFVAVYWYVEKFPRIPSTTAKTSWKWDFQIRRDGFSFQNYGNEALPINLTPANLERLCGETACARGSGNSCVPNGSMSSFMDQINMAMSGGHCEGMSLLAQNIVDKHVSLETIDPKAPSTFSLPFDNETLQSEIAYWFATQATYPAALSDLYLVPTEVIKELEKSEQRYSIHIFKPDGSDGHAVTPVQILRDTDSNDWVWMQVYDNNYPGDEERFIVVNSVDNRWYYEDYEGDASAPTLLLSPRDQRLVKQECPSIGEEDNLFAKNSPRQIWLDGNGSLVAPSDAKKIMRVARFKSNRRSPVPIYVVNPGQEVELKVVGTNLEGKEKSNLAIFDHGQSMVIEGISLDPDESDRVILGKEGTSISYATKDEESVTIRLGLTYKGADYEIKIHPAPKTGGVNLRVENLVDVKDKNHQLALRFKASDSSPTEFAVELKRIGDVNDESFSHRERLSIASNETVTLEYGKWIKNKQPLSILRDIDSDGNDDSNQNVSDDD